MESGWSRGGAKVPEITEITVKIASGGRASRYFGGVLVQYSTAEDDSTRTPWWSFVLKIRACWSFFRVPPELHLISTQKFETNLEDGPDLNVQA